MSRFLVQSVLLICCSACLRPQLLLAQAPAGPAGGRAANSVSDYLFKLALAADGVTFAAGSVTEFSNDGGLYVGNIETRALHWSTRCPRVVALAFSPDGALIATGHSGAYRSYGEVRLWNARTGTILFNLLGHRGLVYSVAFSPDGRYVASAGREITRNGRSRGQLFVWDTQTGEARAAIDEKRGPVGPVTFSHDGARVIAAVASSAVNSKILIRDAGTGRLVSALGQRFGPIMALAASPDGRHLAIGSADDSVKVNPWRSDGEVLYWLGGQVQTVWKKGRVTLVNLLSGERVWTYRDFHGHVNGLDYSGDGSQLAATAIGVRVGTSDRGNVARPGQRKWVILSADSGGVIGSRSGEFMVDDMAFSTDGRRLITTGIDNRILVWSPNGELSAGLARKGWLERRDNPTVVDVKQIVTLAFSRDSNYLLSGDDQGTLGVWDVDKGTRIAAVDGQAGFHTVAVFTAEGSRLAFSNSARPGHIGVFELASRAIRWLETGSEVITCLAQGPNVIVGGAQTGELFAWNARDWSLRARRRFDSGVRCVAVDPSSGLLAVGCAGGVVHVVDEDLKPLRTGRVRDLPVVQSVSLAPRLRRLAVAGSGGQIKLLDPTTLEVRETAADFEDGAASVCFSSDGRHLAAAGLDGGIACWSTSPWKRVWRAKLEFSASSVAFSPDGRTLAGGWGNNLVALYDVQNGRLLTVLK